MLDDNDEQARVSIRAQANSDAQAFLSEMLQSEGASEVPPPPTIDVSETSAEPIKFSSFDFGVQSSGAQPHGQGPGPPPQPTGDPTGACCIGPTCIITTAATCTLLGGTYQGDDSLCSPDPC